MELDETVQQCASRELFEETGLKMPLNKIEMFSTTNDIFYGEHKHYVTIHCRTKIDKSLARLIKVKEPNKCENGNGLTETNYQVLCF